MSEFDQMPDAKEFKEIMIVISETVPELLDKITKVISDNQEGTKMGKSVASFYTTLVESGMPKDQAFNLTKNFMSSASLGGMIASMGSGIAQQHH
ncbi:MAG: hypothetical protein GKC03_09935 [Methanomassiliicoccales archaeon]|nr:hypothetical protein [Methanomassiliicoccales archaeon]NYT15980.1 hypothetical protein [Methanomassiliicoccales archaeon]